MILLQFSMWKAELQVTLDNHVELMLSFQMKIFPPNCELILCFTVFKQANDR